MGTPRLDIGLTAVAIVAAALASAAAPARAAAGAGGAARPLSLQRQAERLDLLLQAGQAHDAGRFDEAARLYRRAAAMDPGDGQPLVLAGVAAYRQQATRQARRDLQQALRRPLLPADRALARLYLDLIADDQRTREASDQPPVEEEWSATVATTIGGGYDSNPRQVVQGAVEAEGPTFASDRGALYAAAGAQLGISRELAGGAEVELGYGVEQSAYQDRQLADLDFLEHRLVVEIAQPMAQALRLGFSATGELSFTGVGRALHAFQQSVRLEPEMTVGTLHARFRFAAAWQATETLDPAVSFLSGTRFEASAGAHLVLGDWRTSLTGRLRRDALGVARTPLGTVDPMCPDCGTSWVVPYSNASVAASFRVLAPFRWRMRPGMSARWEMRSYDQPSRLEQKTALALERLDSQFRRDQRLGLGASVACRLADGYTLDLKYNYSERATLAGDGYDKQVVTVDLTIDWL
jgi:tetratricopeptide (TPR) repeat protein